MKPTTTLLLGLPLLCLLLLSATIPPDDAREAWVESTFNSLTEDQRIAQLFMIRAHSNKGADHIAKVTKLVRDYQVGGLCFFQGTPEKQAELTNKYQQLSKVPLMISMDAEWGLGMRMKASTVSFPHNMTLGAIQNNNLLYDMGQEVARQCRRLGVHVNFAPVVDINNNKENPVINYRSFGEDRYNVSAKSYMYMKGMQDGNLMACAKHFPGHGDTNVDSHYDLPVINHGMPRLDSIEMFPFRLLAQHGIQSMMIAHLHVPSIDATTNLPTTLSPRAVNQILKEEIGFDGLIFTDGLGMKGVTKHYRAGEVEAKALVAGNDILLLPQDVPAALKEIKNYLASGELSAADVDEKVRRVLRAKYDLGISTPQRVATTNLRTDLNTPAAQVLKRKLIDNALTLVRNDQQIVPVQEIKNKKISVLSIGETTRTPFQKTLTNYGDFTLTNVGKEISSSQSTRLLQKLKSQDLVIVSLHDLSSRASKNFGITSSTRDFLEKLGQQNKTLLVVFGNPYSLEYFDNLNNILMAYDDDEMVQESAAQAIFGATGINGRLPVTASPRSKFNDGVTTNPLFRFGYGIPESVGLNSMVLNQIDGLAKDAIATKATPGCVVLVAKDNKIVFHRAYGHHTYSKRTKTQKDDIFDLASITKLAAGTLSAMKLYEEGIISIYQPMSTYIPELQNTDKRDLVIYDIMAHKAGLKAWIPFFEQTVSGSKRNPRPSTKIYKKQSNGNFFVPVTSKLFMISSFRDTMWNQIFRSPLRANKNYKYSDLGFYLINRMVNNKAGMTLDQYADKSFYQPLGLSNTSFNPWQKYPIKRIVPTEEDKYWRRQRVQGYVHDMGAAMLGGVSGHAGLFSTATDLAVIMQMLLNGGYYGGQQILQPGTVQTFTTRHSGDTRRGIGFDMRELDPSRSQNMSSFASANTYGHLGFTGTCVWTDPDENLIYIFLSNRTYPSMRNNKLGRDDYRPRIQDVVYRALQPAL